MPFKWVVIDTNGMNVDNKAKVHCILVQADKLVQDSSPELLGAVGLPQFTLYAQRGFHLKRGAMAECGSKETLARGPPTRVFRVAV